MLGLWFVESLVRLSQFLIFGVTLSMKQAVWIQQGLWAVFKCRTVPHWYVLVLNSKIAGRNKNVCKILVDKNSECQVCKM